MERIKELEEQELQSRLIKINNGQEKHLKEMIDKAIDKGYIEIENNIAYIEQKIHNYTEEEYTIAHKILKDFNYNYINKNDILAMILGLLYDIEKLEVYKKYDRYYFNPVLNKRIDFEKYDPNKHYNYLYKNDEKFTIDKVVYID